MQNPYSFTFCYKERTPLIAGGSHYNHNHHREGSLAKLRAVFTGQPSYLSSFRWIVFGSWWNVLLVFIPLSFVAHHLNWDAALRFGFSFFAIMPLAKVCSLLCTLPTQAEVDFCCAFLSRALRSFWVRPRTSFLSNLERR